MVSHPLFVWIDLTWKQYAINDSPLENQNKMQSIIKGPEQERMQKDNINTQYSEVAIVLTLAHIFMINRSIWSNGRIFNATHRTKRIQLAYGITNIKFTF